MKNIGLVIVIICLCCFENKSQTNSDTIHMSEWEAFPILNYDTDVGFGYGAKGFFYNYLNTNESLDLTIYNSTKGERWYQLIFSVPDKIRRHGKIYSMAFDLTVDYDKLINALYYFNGSVSHQNTSKEKETYTREPILVSAIFSKALTKNLILELGAKFSNTSCYNIDSESLMKSKIFSNTQHGAILFNIMYDSRENLINPKSGLHIKINSEYAKDLLEQSQNYFKAGITIKSFFEALSNVILASRLIIEKMENVMFPNKLFLGGNNSIRGLPQDRYISESFVLFNEEIRFPIFRRFGGVIGVDAGNSSSTPEWILNAILGIRFYMDNFVVRADLGFGKESTGFYFNFGHLF